MRIYLWIVRTLLACAAFIGVLCAAQWVILVREALDALLNAGEYQ